MADGGAAAAAEVLLLQSVHSVSICFYYKNRPFAGIRSFHRVLCSIKCDQPVAIFTCDQRGCILSRAFGQKNHKLNLQMTETFPERHYHISLFNN